MVPMKTRQAFYVRLSATECTEVSLKELIRQNTPYSSGAVTAGLNASLHAPNTVVDTNTNAIPEGTPSLTPRTQRFNIIERLEKRYGGGVVVGSTDLNGDDDDDLSYRRGDDEDLYDSEDSFIDDEELQQNIEEIHTQSLTKTKHSGFFVNAGDKIETIEGQTQNSRAIQRPQKSGVESSRAVKAFLDEWSDAASVWQPGPEILECLEDLRRKVQEMTATTPFTKVFPRQLDDALRAVDRLVVEGHPNKWRVNGYFARLMTFLPFTKQYLKSNMLRLEARDVARTAKESLETSISALNTSIQRYTVRVTQGEPADRVKEDILKDKEFVLLLSKSFNIQDEWITKENDYRNMLKTEDKKHLKETEYIQLNQRQERNRIYNRILALFPPGLMDITSLRGISRSAKTKTTRKTPTMTGPQATPAAAVPSIGSNASVPVLTANPATTSNKKTSSALPTATTTSVSTSIPTITTSTPVKRAIKPFKSRMMEDVPTFVEADFKEVS